MKNAKGKIKLIVADVEGCLTPGKGRSFDIESLARIRTYCTEAKKGEKPPLVLCTGRPQPYAEAVAQSLGAFFPGFPSVVENGCFLYDPVKDIIIPNPAIKGKEKKLREIKNFLLGHIAGWGKLEPGKEICISLNPIGGLTVEELEVKIDNILPLKYKKLVFMTHSSSAVDITPHGVDKSAGAKFLSERSKINPSQMLGVGDSLGDLPMLEVVGHVACPANASREIKDFVKKQGGYVAKKSFSAGALEILSYYRSIGKVSRPDRI